MEFTKHQASMSHILLFQLLSMHAPSRKRHHAGKRHCLTDQDDAIVASTSLAILQSRVFPCVTILLVEEALTRMPDSDQMSRATLTGPCAGLEV